jgi:hypothetical protein
MIEIDKQGEEGNKKQTGKNMAGCLWKIIIALAIGTVIGLLKGGLLDLLIKSYK